MNTWAIASRNSRNRVSPPESNAAPVTGFEPRPGYPEFDLDVEPNGYHWWYLDAISDDRRHAITVIFFIGSVFSPYYSWSRSRGRTRAQDHCAVNVVVYGGRGKRWAMTERGADALACGEDAIRIGPSGMRWTGNDLVIDLDEIGVPLPARIRGQIRVRPETTNCRQFILDQRGRHFWQPIFPSARVEVHFDRPALAWRGQAYVDTNHGTVPLEEDFCGWNWSRVGNARGRATILYDRELVSGDRQCLALRFEKDGTLTSFTPAAATRLPSTPVWRIPRSTRCEPDWQSPPRVKTLEDTPFYSRSLLSGIDAGEAVTGVHESLSMNRFTRAWVRLLLPFRMPRAARCRTAGG